MTTTEDLRRYLDAHGVDGPPTEQGWFVADFSNRPVVVFVRREPWGLSFRTGSEHVGSFIFASDITRHAPLTLAPPAGRDLDADVVAGVQAGRDVFAIPREDVRVEWYRCGQDVSQDAVGALMIHIPTGVNTCFHEHRTRHMNKAGALEKLKQVEAVRAFYRGELLRDDLRGLAGKVET